MTDNHASPIRLIDLGSVAPWQTQAYYHAVAETMTADTPDTIILCRPSKPYLCLGYHQVYQSVLDPVECRRRGLPVFRRRVGGGTTYLDGDQLFYQCIFHHSRVPVRFEAVYARLLAAPVAVLRGLGLDAALHEVNEIEVGGQRIAGIGGGRIGEACVVVGNLLFDFDFEAMAAVWRVPWDSFRALAAEAMRERMTTLREHLEGLSLEAVERLLPAAFAEHLGRTLRKGAPSIEEEHAARRLARSLPSPKFLSLHGAGSEDPEAVRALKISARASVRAGETQVNGYHLWASFQLSREIIQAAVLESSPPHDWRSVEEKLYGTPFHEWETRLPTH